MKDIGESAWGWQPSTNTTWHGKRSPDDNSDGKRCWLTSVEIPKVDFNSLKIIIIIKVIMCVYLLYCFIYLLFNSYSLHDDHDGNEYTFVCFYMLVIHALFNSV